MIGCIGGRVYEGLVGCPVHVWQTSDRMQKSSDESGLNWRHIGLRIALLRNRKRLSIRQVAGLAEVDKNTYLRLEAGKPIRRTSLERICAALGTTLGRQKLALAEPHRSFTVARAAHRRWETESPNGTLIQPLEFCSEEVRRDLAASSAYGGFNGFLDCELFGGTVVSSVIELFQPCTLRSFPGEEFLYCLLGPIVLDVGSDRTVLDTGDAVCLWAEEEHRASPAFPVTRGSKPPVLLSVRVDGVPRPKRVC